MVASPTVCLSDGTSRTQEELTAIPHSQAVYTHCPCKQPGFIPQQHPDTAPVQSSIQPLLQSTAASIHCSIPQQHPATAPFHSSIQPLFQSTAASRHCSSPQQHPDTAPAHSSIQTLLHSTAASSHCCSPQQHPATAAVHSSIQTLLQSTAASRDCCSPQQHPESAPFHSSIQTLLHATAASTTCHKAVLAIKKNSREILRHLPSDPAVTEVVVDFERTAWSALHHCLPDVPAHSCWFHWAQAVYRKVKELRKAYTYQLAYLENTWITSTSRPPTPWTTFKRSVRTTNDAEGWHHRLNKSAPHDHIDMYLLASRASTAAATAGNVCGPEEALPSSEKICGVVDRIRSDCQAVHL
ncbi:hypothetical protein LSAT2_017267 [Lamellibrachia satsuma]|nr:hypothetical protein LSAT2_017267 [Lamellibrachia satsuma]